MSFVTLIVIKDDRLYVLSSHYRHVKSLVDGGIDKVLPLLKSNFLDAGYVLYDVNKNSVVNGQDAFRLD